jgi:hypothetical protein
MVGRMKKGLGALTTPRTLTYQSVVFPESRCLL